MSKVEIPLKSLGLSKGQPIKTHLKGWGQFKVVEAFKYEGKDQIYITASTGVVATHTKIENIKL